MSTDSITSITIRIRQVYGNTTIYPVCDRAQLFAKIAGTKTLTKQALLDITTLGYIIRVEQQTFEVAA